MARPTKFESSDILHGVRAAFAQHGSCTTTADIAAMAGVSEGTLFKRFSSKAELFRSAIEETFKELFALTPEFSPLTRDSFAEMCRTYSARFETVVPLAIHMHLAEQPCAWKGQTRPMPLLVREHLRTFFQTEMQRGALRLGDPITVASTFQGTLWHFAFMRAAFGEPADSKKIDRFSAFLWASIAPSEGHVPVGKNTPQRRATRSRTSRRATSVS